MKSQADKGRSERHFEVGDLVYLKLQPFIQSFVAIRLNHKLSFRFFGPYRILQKVGSVAYKLDLPADAKIHPVVHVSQLKKHISSQVQVSSDLSAIPLDPSTELVPIAVIDSKIVEHGSSLVTKLLIHWSDLPATLATWEEYHECHRRFPVAPAWGQAGSRGGGNVTGQMGRHSE